MLDGMRRLCPNVYTRPFDYLDDAERQAHPGLRQQWIEALHLDADPVQLIASLNRIHAMIAAKFPEPEWAESIRAGTRFEYRYWLSPEELDWRIGVGLEMVRRGDSAAAESPRRTISSPTPIRQSSSSGESQYRYSKRVPARMLSAHSGSGNLAAIIAWIRFRDAMSCTGSASRCSASIHCWRNPGWAWRSASSK